MAEGPISAALLKVVLLALLRRCLVSTSAWGLRLAAGIKVKAQRNRWTHEPTLLSAVQLAARLGIPVNWIYVQIRRKRLLIDQQSTGAYLLQNSPVVVNAVRDLRNRTIHHLDLRIIQPHQEGHQHA